MRNVKILLVLYSDVDSIVYLEMSVEFTVLILVMTLGGGGGGWLTGDGIYSVYSAGMFEAHYRVLRYRAREGLLTDYSRHMN
jgi:hypothetical protein